MSKERDRRFRNRFMRMGEDATRAWLAKAEHHLKRQKEHVNAARYALAKFEGQRAQQESSQ